MTIQQLDDKHCFNWRRVAKDANVAYLTALHFSYGESVSMRTARAIINALPISQIERAELIATMFQPDGKKGAREDQAALAEAMRRMEEA